MQPSVANIFARAITAHGERQAAATVTLAIAVEKLAVAQLEIAKAQHRQAAAIDAIGHIYSTRR